MKKNSDKTFCGLNYIDNYNERKQLKSILSGKQ